MANEKGSTKRIEYKCLWSFRFLDVGWYVQKPDQNSLWLAVTQDL